MLRGKQHTGSPRVTKPTQPPSPTQSHIPTLPFSLGLTVSLPAPFLRGDLLVSAPLWPLTFSRLLVSVYACHWRSQLSVT